MAKKNTTPQHKEVILAKGIFKKRFWPWILVVAAVAVIGYAYIGTFFTFTNGSFSCDHGTICSYYPEFLGYHYANFINQNLIVAGILVAVDLILIILFCRKRTLVVTPSAVAYKRGQRKALIIPLNQITHIDTGASKVIVKVPFAKFRFRRLKNKKEIYDTVLSAQNAPVYEAATVAAVAVPVQAAPKSVEEQLQYLQNQLAAGEISREQFTKANGELLKSAYPELYK